MPCAGRVQAAFPENLLCFFIVLGVDCEGCRGQAGELGGALSAGTVLLWLPSVWQVFLFELLESQSLGNGLLCDFTACDLPRCVPAGHLSYHPQGWFMEDLVVAQSWFAWDTRRTCCICILEEPWPL